MRTLAATIAGAISIGPQAAAAGTPAEKLAAACNYYLDRNQIEKAERQAQTLFDFEGLFFANAVDEAERCLTRLHGTPWVYSYKHSTFLPGDDAETAEQALQKKQEEQQAAQARAEQRAATAQQILADRRHQATIRTREACDELYRRDWVSALTNTVCSPFYLTNGLPD
jgi:hypothetical protein